MSKIKSKIQFNNAFTPTHALFTEGENTIEFFVDEESVRLQVYRGNIKDRESFQIGMRIPLWASIALAQMFSKTLNGRKLTDWLDK